MHRAPALQALPLRRFAFLGLAGLCLACSEEVPTGTVVSSGTLSGVPFTVSSGQVVQAFPDGPLRADAAGAVIFLDETPAELGMSDPRRLHLRTQFALQHGGTVTVGAFGTQDLPFGPGTALVIGRNAVDIDYAFYVDSAVFADSTFVPAPAEASEAHWLVTEFYADSVPGYGAGSGLALWPLGETSPSLGEDVLGCTTGPARSAVPMTGDRVAYRLTAGFLVDIQVIDTIIGPCV